MCVLSAISIGSAIAGIVGTAVSVVGGMQQAKAQQQEAEYQAQVAQPNANIANENAAQVRQQGIEDARNQRLKALSTIGTQKAQMAANGMNIGDGSALDTIEDTAMLGEMDALSTMYNAEQHALNYEQQSANFQNQANLSRMAGQNASSASRINAIAGGLNGASKVGLSVSNAWGGMNSDWLSNTKSNIKNFGSSLRAKTFSVLHKPKFKGNQLTSAEYTLDGMYGLA